MQVYRFCSCCGKSGGKKAVRPRVGERRKGMRTKIELDVREWECLFCNTIHDRDINASRNLEQQTRWTGGQSDQYKKERGASVSPTVLAVGDEPLTAPIQLTL